MKLSRNKTGDEILELIHRDIAKLVQKYHFYMSPKNFYASLVIAVLTSLKKEFPDLEQGTVEQMLICGSKGIFNPEKIITHSRCNRCKKINKSATAGSKCIHCKKGTMEDVKNEK